MELIPYTYCVLRYVHDPVAGEAINVGVVVYSSQARFLSVKIEHRYGAFSDLFAGFDGEHFKKVLLQFEAQVEHIKSTLLQEQQRLLRAARLPADALAVCRYIWPDNDLSFQTSPLLAGVTHDLRTVTLEIFERMVAAQRPEKHGEDRRNDEEVWHSYEGALNRAAVTKYLQRRTIQTSAFELKFDHTFKNERIHILQPLSFDLLRSQSIAEKAAKYAGYSVALSETPEVSRIYLLLGAPTLEANKTAYTRAKDYLGRMRDVQIIEENQADDFAKDRAAYIKEHDVEPTSANKP